MGQFALIGDLPPPPPPPPPPPGGIGLATGLFLALACVAAGIWLLRRRSLSAGTT